MYLSGLLAGALVLGAHSLSASAVTQDTAKSEKETQATVPPTQNTAQEGPASTGTASEAKKAAEGKKAPDKNKPPSETKKPSEVNNVAKPAEESNTALPGSAGQAATRDSADKPAESTTQPAAASEPRKIVIRHGGIQEPAAQIVPDMPPGEANERKQKAEESLAGAEVRLRLLDIRSLDSQQKDTVTQIQNYMLKARSALRDGDTQRGYTLALKAYLLADDLVKH